MDLRQLDPIGPSETLGRVLFEPEDFDRGQLTARAIPTQDLSDRERGWSVQRLECDPALVGYVAGERLSKRADLTVQMVALISAGELASKEPNAEIHPWPTLHNKAHALIFGPVGGKPAVYKAVKKSILDLMNRICPIGEVEAGHW